MKGMIAGMTCMWLCCMSFLYVTMPYDLPLKNFRFLKRPDTLTSLSRTTTEVAIGSDSNRFSYPIITSGNDISFTDENGNRFVLLKGVDTALVPSSVTPVTNSITTDTPGTFLTCKFTSSKSQHDMRLGLFPTHAKILTHSRIKRWWMAPSFHSSASTIPVESQLLLIEIDSSASDAFYKLPSINNQQNHVSFPSKKYAVIAPLIDFDTGFRVTLFGSQGGPAAADGNLAVRLESGDDDIKASVIRDALYIAAGNDPYQLLATAYRSIAARMGTFRTRSQKIPPLGIDSFGFCTWDAFYSSVSSDSVLQGVDSLASIGFPPRFLIIDDGWQSTSAQKTSIVTDESKEITGKHTRIEVEETAMSTNLTGTPMTGLLASEQMASQEQSPLERLGVRLVSQFYSEMVERGAPDSWPVKLWAKLSQTVLKDKLIDFFALQTDFSKRLTSWKANSKFENPREGRSLRGLVETLKGQRGVNYVFVWHALSGYWGGVSEDDDDDLPRDLNDPSQELGSRVRHLFSQRIGSSLQSASKRLAELAREEVVWNSTAQATSSLLLAASTLFAPNSTSTTTVEATKAVRRSFSKPTPHMLRVEPALQWDPSSLAGVGSVALDRLEQMYYRMYSYLAESGVDGVKVDAQSGIGAFGSGNGGGSNIARACVTAMEKNVRLFFGNPAIKSVLGAVTDHDTPSAGAPSRFRFIPSIQSIRNRLFYRKTRPKTLSEAPPVTAPPADLSPVSLVGCMCHSTENLLNFYETSLTRVSDDFYPKDSASQTVHLASCAYNSVMIGEIAIADWDMFHSQHVAAEMHAAARAISGGPVYVSDAPGKHNATLLSRLVLPNGRVLRTMLPARPTLDCLFNDVMRDGKTALKVWSLNKANAVLGLFNVQGSGWDQAARRYHAHNPSPPTVTAESRPRDLPLEFSTADFPSFTYNAKHLYEPKSSIQPTQLQADPLKSFRDKQKMNKKEGSSKSSEKSLHSGMFVAWSSAHRRLHLMTSKNDGLRHSLRSRDWDIVTFCHLHSIPCKLPVTRHARSTHETGRASIVKGVASLFSHHDDQLQPSAEETFLSIVNNRQGQGADADTDSSQKSSSTFAGAVYWAPVGLLDMLNGGGAIEDIVPMAAGSTSTAPVGVFSTRGPGRLGVFCSKIPSRVLVDDQEISTELIHAEPQPFGGYLVSFELAPQGSRDRLLTADSAVHLLDTAKTTLGLNKEYALFDKVRIVSISWS